MLTWSKDVRPHASGEIGSIGCVACFSVYYCGSAPRGESKRYRISCLLPAVKKELGSYSTIDEAKKTANEIAAAWLKKAGLTATEQATDRRGG